jgi:hypothetical protein
MLTTPECHGLVPWMLTLYATCKPSEDVDAMGLPHGGSRFLLPAPSGIEKRIEVGCSPTPVQLVWPVKQFCKRTVRFASPLRPRPALWPKAFSHRSSSLGKTPSLLHTSRDRRRMYREAVEQRSPGSPRSGHPGSALANGHIQLCLPRAEQIERTRLGRNTAPFHPPTG